MNGEQNREYCKKYYREHREELIAKAREYRKKNSKLLAKKAKEYYENHKENYKEWQLRSIYGISSLDVSEMLIKQNNRCAICNKELTKIHKNGVLARYIDHNHTTGEVRGILCQQCNVALGMFNDDPELLRKAADYISPVGYERASNE